jgi:hypothetical protein
MHGYDPGSTAILRARRNSGCECFRVGGVADDVHLAVRMSRTITTAQLVEELKTPSSKWLKRQSPTLTAFAWQALRGDTTSGVPHLRRSRTQDILVFPALTGWAHV